MFFQYNSGNLVYIISPLTSQLWRASRNVMICKELFKHERLKPAILRISEGNINNLVKLEQIINVGLALSP